MNQKTQADSSAPIGCSAADGPQLPHNPARSAAAVLDDLMHETISINGEMQELLKRLDGVTLALYRLKKDTASVQDGR